MSIYSIIVFQQANKAINEMNVAFTPAKEKLINEFNAKNGVKSPSRASHLMETLNNASNHAASNSNTSSKVGSSEEVL